MKTWKCPHCYKLEVSNDDIEMVICPKCNDVNMETITEAKHTLKYLKPEEFKGFEGKQICMRCGKAPAVEKDIFCKNCIKARKEIDENIRGIETIKQEKAKKNGIK